MKIIFRMPRNIKTSMIFTMLFCLIFPWSLIAETTYKAPRDSLSYFLENESETSVNQAPEAVEAPKSTEPEKAGFEVAPPEAAPKDGSEERVNISTAVESIRAKLAAAEKEKAAKTEEIQVSVPVETTPEPTIAVKPVKSTVKPAVAAKVVKIEEPEAAPVEKQPAVEQAVADDYVPFAATLAKMQQNREKRAADAEKLGVILPSQGGDIATVSPTLNKMQQAIRSIMTR